MLPWKFLPFGKALLIIFHPFMTEADTALQCQVQAMEGLMLVPQILLSRRLAQSWALSRLLNLPVSYFPHL